MKTRSLGRQKQQFLEVLLGISRTKIVPGHSKHRAYAPIQARYLKRPGVKRKVSQWGEFNDQFQMPYAPYPVRDEWRKQAPPEEGWFFPNDVRLIAMAIYGRHSKISRTAVPGIRDFFVKKGIVETKICKKPDKRRKKTRTVTAMRLKLVKPLRFGRSGTPFSTYARVYLTLHENGLIPSYKGSLYQHLQEDVETAYIDEFAAAISAFHNPVLADRLREVQHPLYVDFLRTPQQFNAAAQALRKSIRKNITWTPDQEKAFVVAAMSYSGLLQQVAGGQTPTTNEINQLSTSISECFPKGKP